MASKKTVTKKVTKKETKPKTAKFVLVVEKHGGYIINHNDFYVGDVDPETSVVFRYELELPKIDWSKDVNFLWQPVTLQPK